MGTEYTVVIAERNEPDLAGTVENLKETQSADLRISVVTDNSGRGPQFCRNAGIVGAETDVVVVVDAHMRFKPAALDELAGMVRANPDRVYCAKCHHNVEKSFDDSPYAGARWSWKSEDRGQFWILSGKWRDTAETGEIGCVMGACYAFSRELYTRIGAPWRLGLGWGMDEETLSLLTWLVGGRCELADVEVAHQYRVQATLPYQLTPTQALGVWANRLTFLDMLPMPPSDYNELSEWLGRNEIVRRASAMAAANTKEAHKIRKMLSGQKRTWQDWKARFILNTEDPAPGKEELMNRAKRAGLKPRSGVTIRELRKMLDESAKTMQIPAPSAPIRIDSTHTMEVPAPKRIPNRIVQDRGIPCVHCGHLYDHRVTHTYPNQRRRCLCGSCGKPFIAARLRDPERMAG